MVSLFFGFFPSLWRDKAATRRGAMRFEEAWRGEAAARCGVARRDVHVV